MTRVIAVAALLSLFASTPSLAQCSVSDKAALEAFDRSWGDATIRGDRAFLENVIAPNFMGHNVNGSSDRAATIANAVRNAELSRANPQPGATADHFMISCTANTATITHRNVVPPAAGTTNAPFYSRSVHFLEKNGGRWQAISTTGHPLNDAGVLNYMELDWNAAYKAGDAAWIEANYAPNATEVSSRTGALETKAQVIASMKADKSVLESLELSDLNVRIDGNHAVVTGINHVKGRDAAGKPLNTRSRFTDTFVKKDGRWLVWATQGTLIQ